MKRMVFLLSTLLLLGTQVGLAALPETISYQSVLTDENGIPVADGDYEIIFELFDVESGGDALWTETHDVTVEDGLYNVMLGSVASFDLPFDVPYWLSVTVESDLLTPRVELGTVPYAIHAAMADSLVGGLPVPGTSSQTLRHDGVNWVADSFLSNTGSAVGIGTTSPGSMFELRGVGESIRASASNPNQDHWIEMLYHGSIGPLLRGALYERLTLDAFYGSEGIIVLGRDGDKVGIGMINPVYPLDVLGAVQMTGFRMPTGANSGYVLTSDGTGAGSWQAMAAGMPSGSAGQTLRHNGSTWVANGLLYNDGSKIGIGTTSPATRLEVRGDGEAIRAAAASPNDDRYIEMLYHPSVGPLLRGNLFERLTLDAIIGGEGMIVLGRNGDKVGIGIDDPAYPLDVVGTAQMSGFRMPTGAGNGYVLTSNSAGVGTWTAAPGGMPSGSGGQTLRHNGTSWVANSLIYNNGSNVGIGTNSPDCKFEVRGTGESIRASATEPAHDRYVEMLYHPSVGPLVRGILYNRLTLDADNTDMTGVIRLGLGDDYVGIGTNEPVSELDVRGTTTTEVLEITGGSDLAEPFNMSGGEAIEPGMIVVIDEERSGMLRLSDRAYDRKVAGVISGAGGVRPGLTLSQHGVLDGGQNVALTGRVWCWADAGAGPIRPGDRLTTSNTPGHAMAVKDTDRAPGAVLGKAMSALREGRGLVLILVQPQ